MKSAISMTQTPANIAKILALLEATPGRLRELSARLVADQERPLGEGERSFRQGLAHLLNTEARANQAIVHALLLNEPEIPRIHPERDLGKLLRYDRFAAAEMMTYFNFRRRVLLAVLHGLKEKQWARTNQEPGKKRRESVYWQARGLALHELEHLDDFESKLKS